MMGNVVLYRMRVLRTKYHRYCWSSWPIFGDFEAYIEPRPYVVDLPDVIEGWVVVSQLDGSPRLSELMLGSPCHQEWIKEKGHLHSSTRRVIRRMPVQPLRPLDGPESSTGITPLHQGLSPPRGPFAFPYVQPEVYEESDEEPSSSEDELYEYEDEEEQDTAMFQAGNAAQARRLTRLLETPQGQEQDESAPNRASESMVGFLNAMFGPISRLDDHANSSSHRERAPLQGRAASGTETRTAETDRQGAGLGTLPPVQLNSFPSRLPPLSDLPLDAPLSPPLRIPSPSELPPFLPDPPSPTVPLFVPSAPRPQARRRSTEIVPRNGLDHHDEDDDDEQAFHPLSMTSDLPRPRVEDAIELQPIRRSEAIRQGYALHEMHQVAGMPGITIDDQGTTDQVVFVRRRSEGEDQSIRPGRSTEEANAADQGESGTQDMESRRLGSGSLVIEGVQRINGRPRMPLSSATGPTINHTRRVSMSRVVSTSDHRPARSQGHKSGIPFMLQTEGKDSPESSLGAAAKRFDLALGAALDDLHIPMSSIGLHSSARQDHLAIGKEGIVASIHPYQAHCPVSRESVQEFARSSAKGRRSGRDN